MSQNNIGFLRYSKYFPSKLRLEPAVEISGTMHEYASTVDN
jgi:hypothetical protein